MTVALNLSDALVEDAKVVGAAEHRSVPKQIEYRARIGRAVLENPDLRLRPMQLQFAAQNRFSTVEPHHGEQSEP